MPKEMPQKRRQELPPLDPSIGPFGERLARLRKQQGKTQIELARAVGIAQPLLSDYERGRLQMSAEMAVRFALALRVSCDELLGTANNGNKAKPSPRRLMKRLEKIEKLSSHDQRTLLRTIDGFLKGVV